MHAQTMDLYHCNTSSSHSQIYEASHDLNNVLGIENNRDFEGHPLLNTFIATYRALPIAARAKVENWLISMDDIKMSCQALDTSGMYQATYHGAEVSVAKHTNTNLKDHEAQCLQTEIRAMAQLRHPNIVSFLGAHICSDTWTVVTERMPHGSVRSLYLCKQAQQPSWRPSTDQALAWALDLARAVTYLHHSDPSVTHRDLRPDTVFVASSGALKVAGFRQCALRAPTCTAAACKPAPPPCPAVPCADGGLAGAAEAARVACYTAPELARDGACDDRAVDVNAAAAVISYLRTGRDPAQAALSRSRSACLPWHAGRQEGGWGRRAGGALAAAAARDPAERPAADALVDALEEAAALRGRGGCMVS